MSAFEMFSFTFEVEFFDETKTKHTFQAHNKASAIRVLNAWARNQGKQFKSYELVEARGL
jgi:hypothetical protein